MNVERLSLSDTNLQEFISKNSKCIFSSADWYKVLEEGFNSKVLFYGLRDGSDLKLVIPGILLNFKIIKMFYSNIPYGGFIGEKTYITDFLPLLEKELKKAGVDIFRVCKQFSDGYDNLNGYKLQSGCQQIINIEGLTEQELWTGYKKRVRRDIRRAEKLGVDIKELSSKEEVDILYRLYVETMKRNNTYPTWTRKAIHSIYEHLVSKGKAKVLFAKLKEKYIAGVMLIYSEGTLYYFISSSVADYLSFCPNDLLMHRTITLGIQKGKKHIDLMTSRESDTKLIKFKEKWGSQRHPFHIFEKDLNFTRACIWHWIWKIANSKPGGLLVRLFRK